MFKNNRGEVATIFLITTYAIIGIVAFAFGSGNVNYPDFHAKPKTLDTLRHPAPTPEDKNQSPMFKM